MSDPSLEQHPAFRRELRLNEDVELDSRGWLLPKPRLVQEVADVILNEDLRAPGALVIGNITDFFDSFDYREGSEDFEKVRNFQKTLFNAAWEHARTSMYPDTGPEDFLVYAYTVRDSANRERKPTEGSFYLEEREFDIKTPKRPHLDADDHLLGIAYGPITNVTGGELLLVDFARFLKDQQRHLSEFFYPCMDGIHHSYYLRASKESLDLIKGSYSVQIKTSFAEESPDVTRVPMVFWNNRRHAHWPLAIHPSQEDFVDGVHRRHFFRTAVTPRRERAYWQQRDPFPYFLGRFYRGMRTADDVQEQRARPSKMESTTEIGGSA